MSKHARLKSGLTLTPAARMLPKAGAAGGMPAARRPKRTDETEVVLSASEAALNL